MAGLIYTAEIVIAILLIVWILRTRKSKGTILLVLFIACLGVSTIGAILSCPENGAFKNILWALMNSITMYTGGGAGSFPSGTPLVSAQTLDYISVGYQLLRLATIVSAAVLVVASVSGNLWDKLRNVCRRRPYDTVVLIDFDDVDQKVIDDFIENINVDYVEKANMLVAVDDPHHYQTSSTGRDTSRVVFELATGKRIAQKADKQVIQISITNDALEKCVMTPEDYKLSREKNKVHKWEKQREEPAENADSPNQVESIPRDIVHLDFADISARNYINAVMIPHIYSAIRDKGLDINEAMPSRFLIIGDLSGLGGDVLRYVTMNTQRPDGVLPYIQICDNQLSRHHGAFTHRYPKLGDYAAIEYSNLEAGSDEFYAVLQTEQDFDEIIVATDSEADNVRIANCLALFLRRSGAKSHVSVYCPTDSSALIQGEKIDAFGKRSEAISVRSLIDDLFDATARQINNFYCGGVQGNEEQRYSKMIENWRNCTQFNKESSRASADFLPVQSAWKKVLESDSQGETDIDITDRLARLEHQRWCAFHAAQGFRTMSIARMQERFKKGMDGTAFSIDDEGHSIKIDKDNAEKIAAYARCDSSDYADTRLEHICLIPWDALLQLDKDYLSLQSIWSDEHPSQSGLPKERNFRKADEDVLKAIDYYDQNNDGREAWKIL